MAESIAFCVHICGLSFQSDGSCRCKLVETSLPPSAPCHWAGDTSVLITQKGQEPIRGTGLSRAGAGMRDSTAPWTQTTRTGARLEETNQPAPCCLGRERGTKGGIKRRSNEFCFWRSHLSTKAAIISLFHNQTLSVTLNLAHRGDFYPNASSSFAQPAYWETIGLFIYGTGPNWNSLQDKED